MKTSQDYKVVPAGAGQTLWVAGGRYTVKASGEDTGGAYTLMELLLPPESGPPPHLHTREEESFYILEGALQFQVGEDRVTAEAGAYVKAPRGLSHSFKNVGTAPARVLMLITPPGLENFFAEISQPAGAAPSAQSLEKVKAIAPRYGVTILTGD